MSRTLPAALATEFGATELKPFYAVELAFDSGTLRFWTGYGQITANNVVWDGAANVLNFNEITEATDLSARGINLTFSGLTTDIIAVLLGENYRGRSGKVYIGALDALNQPVSDMYQVFAGRMDVMSINETGDTATIQINLENVLIDLERPRTRKLTNEEQLERFPGDTSLEGVAALQDRQISWGR